MKEREPDKKTVDIVTEWVRKEPPGLDRVDKLPIPEIPRTLKRRSHFRVWRGGLAKIIAAAALFLLGFAVGQLREAGTPDERPGPTAISVNPVKRAEIDRKPDNSDGFHKVAYKQERDGKLFIETQLKGSGAQAVWVVDGSFKRIEN